MAKLDVQERMYAAIKELQAWSHSPDIDVNPECEDDWSRDYAIILVDINEPKNTQYIDVHQVTEDLVDIVAKHFGRNLQRVTYPQKAEPGLVLNLHRLSDWDLEIEVFRKAPATCGVHRRYKGRIVPRPTKLYPRGCQACWKVWHEAHPPTSQRSLGR